MSLLNQTIEALATRIMWLDKSRTFKLNNHRLGIFYTNKVGAATRREIQSLGYALTLEGFPAIFEDLRRNTILRERVGALGVKTRLLLYKLDNGLLRQWNGQWGGGHESNTILCLDIVRN